MKTKIVGSILCLLLSGCLLGCDKESATNLLVITQITPLETPVGDIIHLGQDDVVLVGGVTRISRRYVKEVEIFHQGPRPVGP